MSFSSLFTGFNRSLDVHTVESYFQLPRSERTHLGFWYLKPFALPWDVSALLGGPKRTTESGWTEWEARIKKEFPIQFFLRDTVGGYIDIRQRVVRHWWYDHVVCHLRPRQKWLTKKIPKTWCDKTTLIPLVLFEMVVNFVDSEKCFENVEYSATEEHAKFAYELRECYGFITETLPELERQLQASYPTNESRTGVYEDDYALVNQYEKEIEEQTTKWLTWIVANRSSFWV